MENSMKSVIIERIPDSIRNIYSPQKRKQKQNFNAIEGFEPGSSKYLLPIVCSIDVTMHTSATNTNFSRIQVNR